ncbi:unnamed protein product [Allacma fusca]|uniref:Transmembrane protein 53 n=1 Tax=Allacma fusca TaxID=39272 RepID=A0A8J2PAB9_9HEXA|nr:unnamed protein product [Allacma fusca]
MSDPSALLASLNFQLKFPQVENFHEAGIIKQTQGIQKPDIESRGDQKPIVAVLLGWFGAEYKYLAKYSDIYLEKGCIVLECITPMKIVMTEKSKFPIIAHRVISILEEHDLECNPLFFHALSNAGAWVYSYIVKELEILSKGKQLNIKGTVFDSAPFPLSTHRVYNTMLAHYNSNYLFGIKYPMAAVLASLWSLRTFWWYNQMAAKVCLKGDQYERGALVPSQQEPFPLYNWLPRICGVRNHAYLFLYSKADSITPWREIEKIASTLRFRGNSVMLVKFPGSKHVQHLRKHPEVYAAAISTFLLNQMNYSSSEKSAVYWN